MSSWPPQGPQPGPPQGPPPAQPGWPPQGPPGWPPQGPPRQGMPGWLIGLLIGGGVLILALIVILIVVASGSEAPIQQTAPQPAPVEQETAATSGCTDVFEEPATLEAYHLGPGEEMPQEAFPATSGPHAAGALPAGIYTEYVNEAEALHSMEHGYVVIWYDPEVLPQETFDAVATVANQAEVIMAPYDLEQNGIVFASWERLQGCDAAADPNLVSQAAATYITSYLNAPNAPEPHAG